MLKKAGAKVGLGFVCYVVKKIKSNLQKILSDSKIYNSVSIAVTKMILWIVGRDNGNLKSERFEQIVASVCHLLHAVCRRRFLPNNLWLRVRRCRWYLITF